MSKTLEKICVGIIRWGSFLILFIPFLSPDIYTKTLFPYVFPKIIVFQVIVEIILAVWLFLITQEKEYRPNFKNPLVLSLTAFAGVLFITMFTGVDASRSFWGTQERMTGVLTMLHFYFWFLILSSVFRSFRDWKKFIWASLGCSFLVGLYAWGQKLGVESLIRGGIRLSSTLGNPIYLSVYAMLHIFLAGFLALLEKKWLWRGIAMFFLVFNLTVMPFGASRAVLGSFGVTFLLFLIFLLFILPSKKAKIGILAFLILLIAGGSFLFIQRDADWMKKSPYFVRRVMNVKQIENSLWKRTEAWKIAYQGFQEKPITGWGWENYNIVFNKHYNPRYLEYGIKETWWDKSHNQVTDILALTGILGIVSYFAVFASLAYLLIKKLFKKEVLSKYKMAIGILGLMFVAYFLQNLFVFDTPAPLIVFYFSFGLVCFIGGRTSTESPAETEKRFKPVSNWSIVFAFCLGILLLLGIYEFNIRPFQKSNLIWTAALAADRDLGIGIQVYKIALAESSFTNAEGRMQLASSVFDAESRGEVDNETLKEAYSTAIDEMEKSTKEHPLDARYYIQLGRLANDASIFDKNYLEKANEALSQSLELSPRRQEAYFRLGRTKLLQEKNKEAIEIFRKAVELNKKIDDAHWMLGLALLVDEQLEEGLAEIEKARGLGHGWGDDLELILFIAQSYGDIENYNQAVALCNIILKKDPNHAKTLGYKIIYLNELGKKEEAGKLLERLSEINSDIAGQVRQMINPLEE